MTDTDGQIDDGKEESKKFRKQMTKRIGILKRLNILIYSVVRFVIKNVKQSLSHTKLHENT